jgi:hypothetical protein
MGTGKVPILKIENKLVQERKMCVQVGNMYHAYGDRLSSS